MSLILVNFKPDNDDSISFNNLVSSSVISFLTDIIISIFNLRYISTYMYTSVMNDLYNVESIVIDCTLIPTSSNNDINLPIVKLVVKYILASTVISHN